MHSINIDFEVFKELTIRRETEEMTYNDVIRNLLGLEAVNSKNDQIEKQQGAQFISKGIIFPHGTKFRSNYKGRLYYAEVDNGSLVYNGETHSSFSSAAMAITKTNVNGWNFWECQRPNETGWIPIKKVRDENKESRFVHA